VEYVWIGGTGMDIRSKCRKVKGEVKSVDDLPEWNYDGSSTGQAPTENSEVLMIPVVLFNDPFRGSPNKIALCEAYHTDGTPANTNFRYWAKKIFDHGKEHEPNFGIEQEYFMFKKVGEGNSLSWPLGWPIGGYPKPQFGYYCGNGSSNSYGRELMDAHMKACLYAGVQIYGTNGEVAPGQWEYQIGTCRGIDIGDHMWISRYLLLRCGELFGIDISFEPKPIKGDWNGSGCHTNYSNKYTMAPGGYSAILEQLKKMDQNHKTSIKLYGKGNNERLTGFHETSSMDKFSFGVANRGSSVRIPRTSEKDQCGYYEDRRPAANIDPYVVCSSLFSITCCDNWGLDELVNHYTAFSG